MCEFSVDARIRDHYDRYYQDTSFGYKHLSRLDTTANILNLCAAVRHDKVLEIGSGDGVLLELLSEETDGFVEGLWAVEIAESAVAATKRRNIPKLRACCLFDGYTLPFGDDEFDVAIMSHVLEHVEYPRRILYEAARVSRHVFVEVPLELTARLAEDHVFGTTGHINFYSRKSIRRLVQSCGFEVVGQLVKNPSMRVYKYNYGRIGVVKHMIKEVALRMAPRVAGAVWSYHCALLYRKAEHSATGP